MAEQIGIPANPQDATQATDKNQPIGEPADVEQQSGAPIGIPASEEDVQQSEPAQLPQPDVDSDLIGVPASEEDKPHYSDPKTEPYRIVDLMSDEAVTRKGADKPGEGWTWSQQFFENLKQDWENLEASTKQLYLDAIGEDPEKQEQVRKQIIQDRAKSQEALGEAGDSASAKFAADVVPYLIGGPKTIGAKMLQMGVTGFAKGGAEAAGGSSEDILKQGATTGAIDAAIPLATVPMSSSKTAWSPARWATTKGSRAVTGHRLQPTRMNPEGQYIPSKIPGVEGTRTAIRDVAQSRTADKVVGGVEKAMGGLPAARYIRDEIVRNPLTSVGAIGAGQTFGGAWGSAAVTAPLYVANRMRAARQGVQQSSRMVPQAYRNAAKRGASPALTAGGAATAANFVEQQLGADRDMTKLIEDQRKRREQEQQAEFIQQQDKQNLGVPFKNNQQDDQPIGIPAD